MLAANPQPMPKEGVMLLAADTPSSTNPWVIAAATIAATLVGAIIKTFVDLIRIKDDSQSTWRNQLLTDVKELRDWNQKQQEQLQKQQGQLDTSQKRIEELEAKVVSEQTLRHELRNQLQSERVAHELLKSDYDHVSKDRDTLLKELTEVKARNAKLEADLTLMASTSMPAKAKGEKRDHTKL